MRFATGSMARCTSPAGVPNLSGATHQNSCQAALNHAQPDRAGRPEPNYLTCSSLISSRAYLPSPEVKKVKASPVAPALPVRPILCT